MQQYSKAIAALLSQPEDHTPAQDTNTGFSLVPQMLTIDYTESDIITWLG